MNDPVLGGKYGTCFDISVIKEDPGHRMWVSWHPQHSVALVTSADGSNFSDPPNVVLDPTNSGWENDINRAALASRGVSPGTPAMVPQPIDPETSGESIHRFPD